MNSTLPQNVLLSGAEIAPVPDRNLNAGLLRAIFRDGVLRYIKFNRHEILRAVYFAVRDENWRTIPGVLSNVDVRLDADSFTISCDCAHLEGDIDFRARLVVAGDSDGTIEWRMEGRAFSSFSKNRIGLCVLHPLDEFAGKPCQITHTDGTVEQCQFPAEVAPHQPFLDVACMTFSIKPDLYAELLFTGDVFETEDQRNWTDASFKTYSTPLSLPYPARMEKGTVVSQGVTLKLRGTAPARLNDLPSGEEVTITLSPDVRTTLPRIGFMWAGSRKSLSDPAVARLKSLRADHLGVKLHAGEDASEDEFWKAVEEAKRFGLPLEVALAADTEQAPLKRVLDEIRSRKADICAWLADVRMQGSSRGAEWNSLEAIAPATLGSGPYFAELNRNRPSTPPQAGIWFSMNPQVHATDDTTLIENLASQAFVLASIRSWAGSVPITVSPVTLKTPQAFLRWDDSRLDRCLPEDVDQRQASLLGAGWTLGTLKHLAEGGVASVTFYETAGWKGIVETQAGSPLPSRFFSIPDAVFPMYHVFADVAGYKSAEVMRTRSSDPLRVESLALIQTSGLRLLVANLSGSQVSVNLRLEGVAARAELRVMDQDNVERFMTQPESRQLERAQPLAAQDGAVRFDLKPYAIATVDAVPAQSQSAAAHSLGGRCS